MNLAAFDIGGTNIKWGIVTEDGCILNKGSFPSNVEEGAESLIERVQHKSIELKRQENVKGIAISSAGQVNSDKGKIVHATDNIPGYTGTDIAGRLTSALELPVHVENDVNCTALGEAWMGNATGVRNFLCVTIGTGIGGALVIEGKLVSGDSWCAGEIGHLPLYPGGKSCTCGNKGCLEQYASASALERQVEERKGQKVPLPEFFEKVKSGAQEEIDIFEHWIDHLTTGLQGVVHLLNPSLLLIGGGISAQKELLEKSILEAIGKKIMPSHLSALKVQVAGKGNEANLLGAVRHFLDKR